MEILVARTLVHPADLGASLAFYRDRLGLAVAREFGEGEQRGVVFHTGGGLLEVVGGPSPAGEGPAGDRPEGDAAADAGSGRPPVALWFQVRDLAATVATLERSGVELVRSPRLEPWGLLEAWIADPDGLRIHLVEVPDTHPLRRDTRNLGATDAPARASDVP
ncbi:MAG: VOC family protein [Actinomycetota bacterium]|nr:VOC family protein [Actinomycetota bacterium]